MLLSHNMEPIDPVDLKKEQQQQSPKESASHSLNHKLSETKQLSLRSNVNFDGTDMQVVKYDKTKEFIPTENNYVGNEPPIYLGSKKESSIIADSSEVKSQASEKSTTRKSDNASSDPFEQRRRKLQQELREYETVQKRELEERRQREKLSMQKPIDYWPFGKMYQPTEKTPLTKEAIAKRLETRQKKKEFAMEIQKQVDEKRRERIISQGDNERLVQAHIKADYWKPQPVHRHVKLFQRPNTSKVTDPITGRNMPEYPLPKIKNVRREFDFDKWEKPKTEPHNSLPIGNYRPKSAKLVRYPKLVTDVVYRRGAGLAIRLNDTAYEDSNDYMSFGRPGCGAPILRNGKVDPFLVDVRGKNSKLEKINVFNYDYYSGLL